METLAAILILLATPEGPPYHVGGDVHAPVAVTRVAPDLRRCREHRVTGISVLEAVIDTTGHARDIKIRRAGMKCVDEAAVVALRLWRFKPGTLNGKPVDVIFNLTVLPHPR
jgi:TonB family protein